MSGSDKGKLYIVPTPIGNLADITLRALSVLKEVDRIAAEDTRNSARLLKHYDIRTPMFSYHKFNERQRVEKIIAQLKDGQDIAVISDAGTPGISDPALILIREALQAGIRVETLPGPTALIPALVSSGMATQPFHFLGFLPDKEEERNSLLVSCRHLTGTLVFYEAPHRLMAFLNLLQTFLGDRAIVLAREISKLHETFLRSSVASLLQNPEQITLKGEFVILVAGSEPLTISAEYLENRISQLLGDGKAVKLITTELQNETGLPRNEIYRTILRIREGKS